MQITIHDCFFPHDQDRMNPYARAITVSMEDGQRGCHVEINLPLEPARVASALRILADEVLKISKN